MAILSQQLLESWAGKASRPDRPPDADINEERRLETSVRFDRINGFDELRRVVAPAVVAEGEDGDWHLSFPLLVRLQNHLHAELLPSKMASIQQASTQYEKSITKDTAYIRFVPNVFRSWSGSS